MDKKVLMILICTLIHVSSAQIPVIGSCPSFDCCKSTLNITSEANLSGVWYLYGGKPIFFNDNTKCTKINNTMLPDNYIFQKVERYELLTEEGSTYQVFGNYSSGGVIDYLVTDLKFPLRFEIIELTNKYLIEVACYECGHFSKEGAGLYVNILTKSKNPSPAVVNAIYAKLEECKISSENIVLHNQSGCGSFNVGGC